MRILTELVYCGNRIELQIKGTNQCLGHIEIVQNYNLSLYSVWCYCTHIGIYNDQSDAIIDLQIACGVDTNFYANFDWREIGRDKYIVLSHRVATSYYSDIVFISFTEGLFVSVKPKLIIADTLEEVQKQSMNFFTVLENSKD